MSLGHDWYDYVVQNKRDALKRSGGDIARVLPSHPFNEDRNGADEGRNHGADKGCASFISHARIMPNKGTQRNG